MDWWYLDSKELKELSQSNESISRGSEIFYSNVKVRSKWRDSENAVKAEEHSKHCKIRDLLFPKKDLRQTIPDEMVFDDERHVALEKISASSDTAAGSDTKGGVVEVPRTSAVYTRAERHQKADRVDALPSVEIKRGDVMQTTRKSDDDLYENVPDEVDGQFPSDHSEVAEKLVDQLDEINISGESQPVIGGRPGDHQIHQEMSGAWSALLSINKKLQGKKFWLGVCLVIILAITIAWWCQDSAEGKLHANGGNQIRELKAAVHMPMKEFNYLVFQHEVGGEVWRRIGIALRIDNDYLNELEHKPGLTNTERLRSILQGYAKQHLDTEERRRKVLKAFKKVKGDLERALNKEGL
eukprot:m.211163 g.211163  ORF g.211163 m.211163 type:complete len:354 (+) comp39751_c0_seq27:2-1063(+)